MGLGPKTLNQFDPVAEQKKKDQKAALFAESEKGKEVAAWVKTQYDKMKTALYPKKRKWYQNLSMYYGEQYYQFRNTNLGSSTAFPGGVLGIPTAPKHVVRTTINLTRSIVRTEISRLCSQKPSATVIPATGEDDDMAAAQAGESLWEAIQTWNNFHNRVLIRETFWKVIIGTAFIKTWWDPNKIDKGSRSVDGVSPVMGTICCQMVTPFNLMVPDWLIEDIEEQPFVFEIYTKTVEWVKQAYPAVFKDKNPVPDSIAQNEIFESTYFQITQSSRDATPDSCLVIEAWIKPGNKYLPNGGMVTMAAGKIVQFEETWPYEHGEYPYSRDTHLLTGTFYGDSIITDITPLQQEYNRSRSAIIESKNRMGRPQLLYAQGSLDPTKLTSEPGLAIPYNSAFPAPQPLPMVQIPAYVLEDLDRIRRDMEDMSGQHEASRGMAPGGVEAATAISFLQEKDDSLLYTSTASTEACVEKVAGQSLALAAQYIDTPRIIRIVGSDGAFDSFEFKGSQIANCLDVKVEGGSSLPRSKPARQAWLMDLFKYGAISNIQMLDMMDIGGVQKLTDIIRRDMKAAQRENLKMKSLSPELIQMWEMENMQAAQFGAGPKAMDQQNPMTGDYNFNEDPSTWEPLIPVNEWDNHQAHIDTHNNFRKGQEFENLDDAIKNQFKLHIDKHKLALQISMQSAMMGQVPPNGMPVGPPAGSGGPPAPGGQQQQQPPPQM